VAGMDFFHIVNQIGVLFFILLIGVVVRKLNIVDDNASKHMATLIVKVTAPLLIISSMSKKSTLTSSQIGSIVLISLGVYTLLFGMTFIIPKILRVKTTEVGTYKFMIMFSNVAFMGFPVAYAIFGEEGIVYAAIFNLPFYFLVFTLGIMLIRPHHDETKFKLLDIINPGVVGVLIGLILFWTGSQLPTFLADSFSLVGGLTTPLSMIVIGVSLAGVKLKNVVANFRLYIYCAIRMLLIPLLVMIILKALGFDGLMLGIPVIITAMPVAANTVILAKEYGGNDRLAAEAIFISTIVCIVTIPLLASLL